MIRGCLNYKIAKYGQGNNVMDTIDGPALTKCSDTAIVIAAASVLPDFEARLNPWGGAWPIQPEDYVDMYFHEERNWDKFQQVRQVPLTHHQVDDINGPFQPERIPQYHQCAFRDVFALGAEFGWGLIFGNIALWTTSGVAVVLCLNQPGHFVTAVCYDDTRRMVGFRDPAPVRWKQETVDADGLKWFGPDDMGNVAGHYTKAWRL